MKKRILILGAGNAQIDAIEYCKSHGYEVIGCSYTTVDCGIPHLDHFEQVDIKDIGGIIDLARKHEVEAIYSIGSDLAIPTVMKASELLGLPHFISFDTAEICHSKDKMRMTLGDEFEGNIPFAVCRSLEEALQYSNFPAMMKPVDSQGQRGCFRVESKADIENHFEESIGFSFQDKVIIEEYVDGPEVSVNSYMQDGEMKFAMVSDRYAFAEYPGGIIKEHRVPSSFEHGMQEAKCKDLVYRIAKKIGINDGPCYFQIKLKGGTNPVIIEVAPRLDGCHMWNLIKHYCGADLLDACFTHLLDGRSVLDCDYNTPREEFSLRFMCQEPNTMFEKDRFDISDALYICYYYHDGDRVLKINGFIEKCGYIIRKTGGVV